jgi:hypothetical protein
MKTFHCFSDFMLNTHTHMHAHTRARTHAPLNPWLGVCAAHLAAVGQHARLLHQCASAHPRWDWVADLHWQLVHPWSPGSQYHKDHIMGPTIPGYTFFCTSGIDRPRACILARSMNIWTLLGFSCRDLVAFLINLRKVKQRDIWLSLLLFCLMIQRILSCEVSLRNSFTVVKKKIPI